MGLAGTFRGLQAGPVLSPMQRSSRHGGPAASKGCWAGRDRDVLTATGQFGGKLLPSTLRTAGVDETLLGDVGGRRPLLVFWI
jgi:hypothetical protein